MLEALEIILKLWIEEGRVTYRGRYYKVVDAPFWPKPIQKPHPPIWFGGSSDAIIEAAAKYGEGLLLTSNLPLKDFEIIVSKVSEAARGRGELSLAPSFTYPDVLGETPSQWLSKIGDYIEAGADYIVIDFSMTNVPPDKAVSMLKEFSKTVFPKYRYIG